MPVMGQHFGEPGRNVDERIAIHVARFDERDRRIGAFGEITRNDAAGRARTNNDDVVGLLGHQCLSFRAICIVQSNLWPENAPSGGWSRVGRALLSENGVATLSKEITCRHKVDRRSLWA